MSWRELPLDGEEGPKRQWCQLGLEEASQPQSRRRVERRDWRQLDADEDAAPRAPLGDWRRPDVDERPSPKPPLVRNAPANLSATTMTFMANLPAKTALNTYDAHGMDPQRLHSVLRVGCICKANCMSQYAFQEVYDLCRVFHSMAESDRQFLLHTMYTNNTPSRAGFEVPSPSAKQEWHILGRKVCVRGFCSVLGINARRLYKDIRLTIDGRRRLDDLGPIDPKATPQLDVCHHFFRRLYTSAAEVLPTGRPRAAGGEDSSEDEGDELDGWTPDRSLVDVVGDSLGDIDPAQLAVRQLPLFSLADLHWQFQAWFATEVQRGGQELCEEDEVDGKVCDGAARLQMPSRRTFSRAWHGSWSKVLRLKFPSDHSCCQTCFELRQLTYNTWAPLPQKLQYARRWRDHLRDQYLDRVLYWNLRFLSRQFDSTVLTIIIDSMDRKKAPWPKYDFTRKPHEIEQLKPRPRMTVTGGIAHGWCTAVFVAQETMSHGSNAYVEVLCLLLDKVSELCKVQGRRFPVHLILQADNTVAQTKNQYASAFCSQMVGLGKFCTVTMNFLMVGHTHEDIDQLFSLLCQYVIRRRRWQTPEEFQRIVQEMLAPRIAERGELLVVRGLRCIRDYVSWLEPQKVTLYGCWGNREGLEAPHSFAFKKRSDLNRDELAQVRGLRLRGIAEDPGDVFCCVKTYMRDTRLQQPPVLVLPKARRDRVHGRPSTVLTAEPLNMTDARAAQLEAMATVYEKRAYGYYRAARALRDLARCTQAPPVPAPGWLDEPAMAQPPVVDAGNEYFGHLPEMSWHMHAKFSRV